MDRRFNPMGQYRGCDFSFTSRACDDRFHRNQYVILHGCPLLVAAGRGFVYENRAHSYQHSLVAVYRGKLKILQIPLMRRNVITCLLNARVIRFRWRRAAKVTAKRRNCARGPPVPTHISVCIFWPCSVTRRVLYRFPRFGRLTRKFVAF